MPFQPAMRRVALMLTGMLSLTLGARSAWAQSDVVTPVDLPIGRSYPISTSAALSKASIAAPDIADVVVINPHELVVNAKAAGETDVVLWLADGQREHFRVFVKPAANQKQVAVYVKFAEVRRDLLRTIGVSAVYRYRDAQGHDRVGTGTFNTDNPFLTTPGQVTLPSTTGFLTVLTNLNTTRLEALLDVQEQKGNVRTLAEPNVLTSNRTEAKFLAGGEIPIPIVSSAIGSNQVTIMYKEFGVKLRVTPEIINDTLVKLAIEPEVSSLDFANAIQLSGFNIPAFQTRRVSTTVDVRHGQSLIVSGLFNDSRNLVKTGIPLLQDIPILGQLFSSTRWQRNESELLVIVTPVIVDPMHPRQQDLVPLLPDTALPARDAIQPRLPAPPRPPSPQPLPSQHKH